MNTILLSVAGFDPTSGAGVSLDLKVFELLGFRGMAVLTSLTSQNTECVKKVHCIPPEFLEDQYETLKEDISISGIKVGMVGCGKNISVIQKILKNHPDVPKIVDPVFKSSSGAWFLERNVIPDYISEINGNISLLTPNIEEASLISRMKIRAEEDMKKVAEKICSLISAPCLVTGGNFQKKSVNLLYDGKTFYFFKKDKLKKKVHGTGCFLSSSLLVYLAKRNTLEKACHLATELTHKTIKDAVQVGQGQHLI
jgi:hydroxymethylpyrimidine/phosphomethylpyrimidine kinase